MLHHLLYIDPGSGSYLIQVIIAAVLGAWFAIKNYWVRVKDFFMKKTTSEKDGETPGSNIEQGDDL